MTISATTQGVKPGVCTSTNRPAAPFDGQVIYMTDVDQTAVWDGTQWTVLAPIAGGRNRIINGGFDVWQRGTSFAANIYNADRWVSSSDATVTTSRQTFTAGTAPVAGYEGTYFQRTAKSAGGSYVLQEQRVEDVRAFAGQTVVLSFWAKADAAVTLTPVIGQFFGSGGSTSVEATLATATLTTSWVRYSMTVAIPSISGKTIGAGNYLFVRPIRVLSASATTIDVWGVQLEAGSVATPFETESYADTLRDCLRYAFNFGVASGKMGFPAVCRTTTSVDALVIFPVEMRTNPSAPASTSGNSFTVFTTNDSNADFSGNIYDANQKSIVARFTTVGATAGAAAFILSNTTTPLIFSAEL